jgi:hypothetical protein
VIRIIILISFLFLQAQVLFAQNWQELKGEHFIIYFSQGKDFAEQVLRKSEKNYERIAADLGYKRYSKFWTWANRVKIYIHPDSASYLNVSGQPEWSQGMADYENKAIHSYKESSDFLTSVLPHEMAHLIFRDFIGFESEVPLWLDEGVAKWEEEIDKSRIKKEMKEFLDKRALLSIDDMMELDVRFVSETNQVHLYTNIIDDKPGFLILDAENLVNLYYLQATSLVGFLLEQYGGSTFTEFCRGLRDGKSLEEALSSAYTPNIHNAEELEDEWIEYLKEE